MKKSAFAVFIASVLLASCGGKKEAAHKTYTYRDTMAIPSTWSPTDWTSENEDIILSEITAPLFDFIPNEAQDGYEVVCEMAEKMPEDITAQYAGNALYGVPADAESGYAWKITLKKGLTWDNGEEITVDDYEYSVQQFLNPEMKNYRASSLYSESMPLANAKAYYDGAVSYTDILGEDGYAAVNDADMWTSLTVPIKFFGDSAENNGGESSDADKWKDGETDLWKRAVEISGGHTYFPLTDELKHIYLTVSAAFGDKNGEAYKEWCFSRTEKQATPWQDVGFIKNSDYEFTVVLSKPLTPFMFLYHSESFLLVRKDLYEANKKAAGDIVKSSYGTTAANTASYGPYFVSDFQGDKSITLSKNEKWFGYSDGKHQNQYQTTALQFEFLSDHNTVMNLFLQGALDGVALSATDMDKYGNSEYRKDTPQSYTYKFSFNTDRKSLERENENGVNHSIIANKDFRHGISLSLDRQKWVETTAPASDAGYGLINYAYVAVPETGELYRNTQEAKAALTRFYGTEREEDITGYDLASARVYFQKAYDDEIAAGYLKADDKIQIDFHCYASNEGNQRRVTFLQDSVNKATEGTSLEGKIIIKLVVDQNYYNNMRSGNADLALTAWGGASFDPYNTLWCYSVPAAKHEFGFNPMSETLSIDIGGKTVTKTYNGWYEALCNGEYSNASNDVKNHILAANEEGLLSYYIMIPLEYLNSSALLSQRLVRTPDHFINELVSNSSKNIQFQTFTMDDNEWAEYCKKQNNQLKY